MSRPTVLVSDPSVPQIAFDILGKECEIIKIQNVTKEEIISKVQGVDAIFWASHLRLDKDIIEAAGSKMKTIGTMSVGYDHIDLDEIRKREITFGNTCGVLNNAVADVAVLLTLAASRRLHEGRLAIENNQWTTHCQWMLGKDIAGSTVGILGLGNIGETVARKLKVFNVKQILYTGHKEKEAGKELEAKFVPLDMRDNLIRESDFIIISCPLTQETEGMCDADFFCKMKTTAVFVNVSRGQIVDQDALVAALKDGNIFAAGLDVMTPEPLPPSHELLKLPNVVLLPHLGSATKNTRDAMAELTAQNILKGLRGEEMLSPVK